MLPYNFSMYTTYTLMNTSLAYINVGIRHALHLFVLPSDIKTYKVLISWSSLWTDVFYLYHIVIMQCGVFYIDKNTYNRNQTGWLITL